jgi:methyl-accepting chemotaxis protein
MKFQGGKAMFRKISVKVAFFVNLVLFVVIGLGTIQLAKMQFASLDEQYKTQAKFDSMVAAKAVSKVFEEALDNRALTNTDLFDTDYSPIPKTDPQKYHTRYDTYTDRAILALQDELLKNPNVVFAVTVDNNGYLPTHNSKYQQPLTGDKEKDKVGNRTKRIFNDPTGLAAAKNTQAGFLQVYKRDTGETMWDVSSPIVVKGKQWGNFRIGLSINTLQKAKASILTQLIISMAVILLISFTLIYFTVRSALHPLTDLTVAAHRVVDGNVNDPITATTKDEIGDLAEVMERMRKRLRSVVDPLKMK